MIIIKGQLNEAVSIDLKLPPQIAILEILKNSRVQINESSLTMLGRFLDKNLDKKIPITANLITASGANDIGEVESYTPQAIVIGKTGVSQNFEFMLNQVFKFYEIPNYDGFFLMGKKNSLYLRNY